MNKGYITINVKVDYETKNMLDQLAIADPNRKRKYQPEIISEAIKEKYDREIKGNNK